MARTYKGLMLTEEHRRVQVRLVDRLSGVIRGLFRKHVRFNDIDASAERFSREAALEVARFREASRMQSVDYMIAFQAAESPDAPPVIEEPSDFDEVEAQRSLLATTRGVLKALSRKGYSAEEAMDRGEVSVVGKATKLAGDGGREVIEAEVRRGNGPVGYARVVDADPCPFCAMLASRGIYYMGKEMPGAQLYKSDAFRDSNVRFKGDGRFKVHDHCCCTLEPVYMRDGKVELPGNGNQLAEEWAKIASGQEDPWLVWQRWRESGTLPENYDGPLDARTRTTGPVRGQREGKKPVPKPMKASERKAQQSKTQDKQQKKKKQAKKKRANPQDEWDKQRFLDHADDLERRAAGVAEEIAALKAAGQSDSDVPVVALSVQHKALLSRIDRYRKQGMKM